MKGKPEGWEQALDDAIIKGKNYENTNISLKELYGEDGVVGGSTYRTHKLKLTGGDEVDEKLDELGKRREVKPQKQAKPKAAWTKKKQTDADGTTLAKIINMGVFQGMLPMCANKELTEEDVQEINPGGAVVANISYFFPESKLEHPLVLLGIRVVILYLKFKSVCGKIKKVKGETTHVGSKDGLKPGLKTEIRA